MSEFQMPFDPPDESIFEGWAIGWCLFCEADWTVIFVLGEDLATEDESREFIMKAVDDHQATCPNRPDLTNPEGLLRWLTS